MITDEEKQIRQKNWDNVVASIELECGPHIHFFDPLMQEYINGDITEEEMNKCWDALGKEIMKDQEI